MRLPLLTALLALAVATPTLAQPKADPKSRAEALEILQKSIAFRTVRGAGQTVAYAEYLKGLLVGAGWDPKDITIEPLNGTAFMIARYPGKDPRKPAILISAHMDVVEAKASDWTRDPFTPVMDDRYIYGRGATDNKFDIAVMMATMTRLKREGWKPGRDVVLAFSGDEETDMVTTAELARRLKGAEMVLNIDGGGGGLKDGQPTAYSIQGAEKTYADFQIVVTDPGGHSSRPTSSNAIYRLARGLERIAAHRFPTMWNEITLASAAAAGPNTPPPTGPALIRFAANPRDEAAVAVLSADPTTNSSLRTTCVATMIEGGHAPNALPQRAAATVNCRIFPGTSSESVRQTLVQVLNEPGATITRLADGSLDSPASPLRADVIAAVRKAVHARYPGLAVVPGQSSGATDSMHFRAVGIPSYGVSGMFADAAESFTHGLNEKAPLAALDGDLIHYDILLKTLAK